MIPACAQCGSGATASASGRGGGSFYLAADEVTAVTLEHVHRADFAAFAPLYGGPNQADPREHDRPDDGNAVLISCRIRVSLDGHSKESVQRAKEEQSQELKALAEELLAIGEKAAKRGVEAATSLIVSNG